MFYLFLCHHALLQTDNCEKQIKKFLPAGGSGASVGTKVMRSLDSAVGMQEFVTGMQTNYNYSRPHRGIGGLAPARMAGIQTDLTGNRWMATIGLARSK